MTGSNGHDKQTVYVTTYALQYMAMVIIIGTIHSHGVLLKVHMHTRYYKHYTYAVP